MNIIYRSTDSPLRYGPQSEFNNIPKLDYRNDWFLGIDGSSTAYGLAVYTYDYSELHMFIFCRSEFEDAHSFRENLYVWLSEWLRNVPITVATYEKTPEGYKPATTHAEKVMRETEASVKNFLKNRSYVYVKNQDLIFDIFPNTWKAFNIPKSEDNIGKVNKGMNAKAVLESAGLDPVKWLKGFDTLPYRHDYDCFEALGVGRYGSHFLVNFAKGTSKVFNGFTKVGNYLTVCKRFDEAGGLGDHFEFVGRFGAGKNPRLCEINETHSLAENLFGLEDKEFNNILIVPNDHPYKIYLDNLFGYSLDQKEDYLILTTKTNRSDVSASICEDYGFKPIYI